MRTRARRAGPSFWVTLPGILTALGSFLVALTGFLTLWIPHCSLPSKSLSEKVRGGAKFTVVFDRLANDIGAIRRDMILHGYYRLGPRSWDVWSAKHPTSPDSPIPYATPPANPREHEMNLWGVIFRFDETGRVYYPPDTSVVVGGLTVER
jgi:hypothetical protein